MAGVYSGYKGFQFGMSAISYINQDSENDIDIPSYALSNAHLIESFIKELPEVDTAPLQASGTPLEIHSSKIQNIHEIKGMGGAINLNSTISPSSDATFSLINKIREKTQFNGSGDKNLLLIDSLQKRISRIPIGSPAIGQISSHYGRRSSPFRSGRRDLHTGIDIAAEEGTPIYASADGEIQFAKRKGSYGKAILIKHPSGYETLYAHLSHILVEEGESVCRGQQIGFIGTTGRSTGPHLHYEILEDGIPIDPSPFIELAHVLRFAK